MASGNGILLLKRGGLSLMLHIVVPQHDGFNNLASESTSDTRPNCIF